MDQLVGATVGGLATGGIYAISASGLTLTYATTGVFNFAHGATGTAAAFLYWELRFNRGVPALVALVLIAGLAAPCWGALVERFIARRLVGATETTKAISTIALLVGLLSFVLTVWNADVLRAYPPLFLGRSVGVLGTRVSYNDLIVLATALVVAVALRVLLYGTRAGVAMRANVDDRTLVILNASDPNRSARLAWCASSTLAALAGILVASKTNLNATTLTLLIVNAYAASVIGRLRSLPLTFLGALGVGLVVTFGATYLPGASVGVDYLRGVVGAIPVGVLMLALVVLRSDRLGTGDAERETRASIAAPSWSGTLALVGLVLGGTLVACTVLSDGDLFSSTRMWGLGLVGLSLVPLSGYAGKLSLAQLSFAGIGAMVAGHLDDGGNIMALVAAGAVAGLAGAVVALPTLRLSGIYLGLSTAAVAIALDRWLFSLPELTWWPGRRVTPWGSGGTLTFTRPSLGPIDLGGDRAFLMFGAATFSVAVLAIVGIRRSALGRRLVAMQDSPVGAQMVGLDTRRVTVIAFTGAASLAGVGGALYGMAVVSAGPSRFDLVTGLTLLLVAATAGFRSAGAGVVVAVLVGSPLLTTWADQLTSGTFAEELVPLLIAGAAIGLGDNPNGFLPASGRWLAPVLERPRRLMLVAGVLVGLWLLRITGGLAGLPGLSENGWWILTSLTVAAVLHPRWPAVDRGSAQRDGTSVPLELLGVDQPLDPTDLDIVDRRLGLT